MQFVHDNRIYYKDRWAYNKAERSQLVSGWLGSRVVSVLDSGAEGPGFKLQSRRCRVTVLGKLFTPIVPLFTKLGNRVGLWATFTFLPL